MADLNTSTRGILDSHGITIDFLARQLKAELRAKETRFYKIKGSRGWTEKRGVKVVAKSEDEALVAISVAALTIRQNARKDAHMLRGDYPKTQIEHSGSLNVELDSAKDLLAGRLISDSPAEDPQGPAG